MHWKREPWLAIDTETTGPDPDTARVVELGAVLFERGKITRRMGMLINPGVEIPQAATDVHGITNDAVKDKPTLGDIAGRFLDHIPSGVVLVGYNWPYDATILQRQIGAPWDEAVRGLPVIDPLVVVRLDSVGRFWKGQGRHRLSNVARRLGIAVSGKAHRASADAAMACMILDKLKHHLPDGKWEADELIRRAREQDYERYQARKGS